MTDADDARSRRMDVARPARRGCATAFAAAGIDALLVTSLANVRYLTGFTGSAGSLLVSADDALFVTDGRYRTQSAEQLAARRRRRRDRDRPDDGRAARDVRPRGRRVRAARARGARVTWAQQRDFAGRVRGRRARRRPGTPVEDLRRVKDAGEVDRIRGRVRDRRRRVRVAAAPLRRRHHRARVRARARVRDARARRERQQLRPDHRVGPERREAARAARATASIERNELVVCDFGCIVDGYCSDMTRTVSVGDPGPDARHLYDVVLESQQAGRAAVAADVDVRRRRPRVARRHRRRGLGRRVLARHRPRRRPRDPRGAAGRVDRP